MDIQTVSIVVNIRDSSMILVGQDCTAGSWSSTDLRSDDLTESKSTLVYLI